MNDQADWRQINDQHLEATVTWLRLKLQRLVPVQRLSKQKTAKSSCGWFGRKKTAAPKLLPPPPAKPKDAQIADAAQTIRSLEKNDPPPAMVLLQRHLRLSAFDRHMLSLCAATELDTRIAALCAGVQDDFNKSHPTFALAFALFDNPDWNTLSPHGPLRYWRLIEINQPAAQPLTTAAMRIDERILNYLKGLNYLDDRLTPLVNPVQSPLEPEQVPPSHQQAVDHIVAGLKDANSDYVLPVVELVGRDSASKRFVASHTARRLGLSLQSLELRTLPSQSGDIETFARLWQRESMLMPLALLVEIGTASDTEQNHLKRLLERSHGVVFLDVMEGGFNTTRQRIAYEINKPTRHEQMTLWNTALKNKANGQPQRLAEQFSFDQNHIFRLAKTALKQCSKPQSSLAETLWQTCRMASRTGMQNLAQRIDAKATWNQLVLPREEKNLLHQITDQVAQRNRVYEQWGFRETMNRGLGISALFSGGSGTGKTMAAEVIANELQIDLYRIDLSAVVSKYIGETEKNLRKLFDGAEDSGAILFFDEADALFGKRSEVKDSHDRYANIEINYLLQRMEAYRGLAILATNMKSALDTAFLRRLRFIVTFPFPGHKHRKKIWQNVFPSGTPTDPALDFAYLAKLNLSGGSIHNVALNAAFMAAHEGTAVSMPLLLRAARTEFEKLEQPVKQSDFSWHNSAERQRDPQPAY